MFWFLTFRNSIWFELFYPDVMFGRFEIFMFADQLRSVSEVSGLKISIFGCRWTWPCGRVIPLCVFSLPNSSSVSQEHRGKQANICTNTVERSKSTRSTGRGARQRGKAVKRRCVEVSTRQQHGDRGLRQTNICTVCGTQRRRRTFVPCCRFKK